MSIFDNSPQPLIPIHLYTQSRHPFSIHVSLNKESERDRERERERERERGGEEKEGGER